MDLGVRNWKKVLASIVALVAIILFGVSWASLEYTEYGLDYNGITKYIDPVPKGAGRYFLGLGHSFIKFPKTVQTIEFSTKSPNGPLKSRTSDGLEVTLAISFQYRLMPDKLFQLYKNYTQAYESTYIKIAKDCLTDQSTNFTAFDFFASRASIGSQMEQVLMEAMKPVFSTVEFFQLRDVDLPNQFEDAIQQAEIARQSIQKAHFQQQNAMVQASKIKMMAVYNATNVRTQAEADAQSILVKNQAEAKSFQLIQETLAKAYETLMKDLNLDQASFIKYLKVKSLEKHNGQSLLIGMEGLSSSGTTPAPPG
jgi:regulator of protease activity HflC (stomatin/prohibitin superfamily)